MKRTRLSKGELTILIKEIETNGMTIMSKMIVRRMTNEEKRLYTFVKRRGEKNETIR